MIQSPALSRPLASCLAAVLVTFTALAEGADAKPSRLVAITIDDLPGPAGAMVSSDVATLRETTRRLLAAVRAHRVPAVGFVNEGKLVVTGETVSDLAARTAVLRQWIDAGLELGNHTYAHKSFDTTPLEEFQQEVIRGEAATEALLVGRPRGIRYFRHPFLQVGSDLAKRRAFESFLEKRGYTIAPVTIDGKDYVFARVYAEALRKGDQAMAAKVASAYVDYTVAAVAHAEQTARQLAGRDIAHVLLMHANALNADHFGAVAKAFEDRGYRFATLAEALRDEAYRMPDTYAARGGVTWQRHWAHTAGATLPDGPEIPQWVHATYREGTPSQQQGGQMRQAVTTDKAPLPIGPYSQAIIEGGLVYVAGQGPVDPVTRERVPGDVKAQTERTLQNLRAILEAAGSSMEKVIRCNVYLSDINEFAAMNEVYGRAFTAPFPARTTIQAAALPGGISVEIDCIARR